MAVSGQGPRDEIPPEVLSILKSSLQVGGIAGTSGLFLGGVAGILRSTTPKLFALASGIQWFTLGTTFWAARKTLIYIRGQESSAPSDMLSVSSVAGAISGGVGGMLRGPRNIIPGAVMFALFGATGQSLFDIADARHAAVNNDGSTFNRWLDSKWSPVKLLSDEEYGTMLDEKLLRVNAQIALVDESIGQLQGEIQNSKSTSVPREAPKRQHE